MNYHEKYIKYKNKYLQLKNQLGGVNKSSPFILYVIGQDKLLGQRTYLCTLLFQIEFLKKYCGITNDRIVLIYGDNGNENIIHTCSNSKAGKMLDKPIPYGINTYYIDDSYDQDKLSKLIKNILEDKVNTNTPLVYLYDGHGYTTSHNEGEMLIRDNLDITSTLFLNIFKPYDVNKKLILFTQCGSFGFYSSLYAKPDAEKLKNIVYLCSTMSKGTCGFGAGILVKLSTLINDNPQKYLSFNDLKVDLSGYFLEDKNSIKISDILLKYDGKPITLSVPVPPLSVPVPPFSVPVPPLSLQIKDGDRIKLSTDDGKYIGYNVDSTNNVITRTPIINNNISIWIVEINKDKIKFKSENEYLNSFTKQRERGYLDIYTKTINTKLHIWNIPQEDSKQQFIINDDMTISPKYNPKTYLIYDDINNTFTHNSSGNKIKYIKI